jgi:phosphomannomutase
LLDGVRLRGRDGWVLALPDSGRPRIKIFAEAKTKQARDKKIKNMRVEIDEILKRKE